MEIESSGGTGEKHISRYVKADLRMALILVGIGILIAGIYFRLPLLKFTGFYEPDGFYHFSVIRAAVNNGFRIPHYLSISGWPVPTQVTEPDGMYAVTLIPYFFLRYAGISYYTIMRFIPILFGLFDIIGAYFLVKYLSKDRMLGILAMLLVALSGGDEARTSALVYRGDGFVTIFLIIALIFLIEVFKRQSKKQKVLFALGSGFALSVGNLVWNGAAFAVGVYALSFVVILSLAFILSKENTIDSLKYVLASMLLWFVLTTIYIHAGLMVNQTFTSGQFAYLFIPVLAGWAIAYFLTNRSHFMEGVPYVRIGILAAFAILGIILAVTFAGHMLRDVFVNNGFITSGNSHAGSSSSLEFYSTIQELQPPTPGFLLASFATSLYFTPPTIFILLSTYFGHITLFLLLVFISFAPYLLMQVYDAKDFFGGSARIRFELNEGMLVVLSYFAATAYLQIYAIRFNSLISIPIAMLAAYTIYWLATYSKSKINFTHRSIAISLLLLILGVAIHFQLVSVMTATSNTSFLGAAETYIIPLLLMVVFFLNATAHEEKSRFWASLGILAMVVIFLLTQIPAMSASATIAVEAAVLLLAVLVATYLEKTKKMALWHWIVIALLLYTIAYFGTLYTANLAPADAINHQFINATYWLKNNTPNNSVILTLWPDGSVVEGFGNRTSVMDSVGAQNYTKADAFALWLMNSTPDPGFITSPGIGHPDYLLVRNTWLAESGGIFQEADVGQNLTPQDYANIRFSTFNQNANASVTSFKFLSAEVGNGVSLAAVVEVHTNTQGQKGIQADLELVNSTTYQGLESLPLRSVVFYNQSTNTYSEVNTSLNVTASNGYTILLNYSNVPRSNAIVNITGAYAMSPGLANSNLFKLLYLCGSNGCDWNNSQITLHQVYGNGDTKIYRIVYNNTAGT